MPCGKLCAGTRVAKCFSLTDAILERGGGESLDLCAVFQRSENDFLNIQQF